MCTVTPGSNHDFMTTVYRVVLSSPVMPDLIVDYDMSKKNFSVAQQEYVTNYSTNDVEYCSENHDSNTNKPLNISSYEKGMGSSIDALHGWKNSTEKYICEENEVVAHDGTRIPLTILFSRSAYEKGQSPGLLHGYGAYGEVLDKSWCSDRLSLLDRGWMFAFADVRGGAGANPSWHSSGRGSQFTSYYIGL